MKLEQVSTNNNAGMNELLVTGNEEVLRRAGAYIVTQDTKRLLMRFGVSLPDQNIQEFNTSVRDALEPIFPVVMTDENEFYDALGAAFTRACTKANAENAEVILLDRFISAPGVPTEAFSTLSIGRVTTANGEVLGPRPGDPDVDDQLSVIQAKMEQRGTNKIILVDDGLSTLDALEPYENIARAQGWKIVDMVLGVLPSAPDGDEWNTKKMAIEITGKSPLGVLPVVSPLDWICERDFTLFGGKTVMIDDVEYPLTAPYFSPFINGQSASIPADRLNEVSQKILRANQVLVAAIDQQYRQPLTFADVLTAGYGLPVSLLGKLPIPKPEDFVGQFIDTALACV
ncbi:hypothetical protein HY949_01100 [Candidatus Gottesmanbacteria bacterium]|nr:hypothetical protein [Candidatus Gottesmanbacteria bacterium]